MGLEKLERGIRRAALPLDVKRDVLAMVRQLTDSTLVAFLDTHYYAAPEMDHAAVAAERAIEVLGPVFMEHGVEGPHKRNVWVDVYLALGGQKSVAYEAKGRKG